MDCKNPALVQQLRDRLQDALSDYEAQRGQAAHRRVANLYFLYPLLQHVKILAKDFWLMVKKSGRVVLHKLLSEMLEFMYT